MPHFTLTDQHLKLLKHMNVGWNDAYYGAPTIDIKRPYGNGDVVDDITEILGMCDVRLDESYPDRLNYILKLHKETRLALQVCLSTRCFIPGEYLAPDFTNNWKRLV